ncbi:uncharacterized protein LOC132759692 [Ruditapes philippinarum]|uniref:uncharacterized protein LOC132759692 n=1 Tax=Ruditapes philippinarum TaxID=129788 RepID=UPI00295BBB6C|nr:uncharacterized protein LOC132759692 [Ruditapes philippinarum]
MPPLTSSNNVSDHFFISDVQQLQGVDSPRKLFDCLKKGKFIGQYNILYIQQIVRVLEREDLVGILNKYVEVLGEDKVLHFIEKSKETVNGYSQIEFHIKGHGISDPTEIETFRIEVSRLLLCPLHEVIINGIQATNSTVLTIMIPTMYATFLVKQLEKYSHRIISSVMAINVDTITVNNDKFEMLIEGKIYKAKKERREHGPIQLAEQDCAPRRNGNKQQTTNAQALLKNERKRSIIETRSHAKHDRQVKQLSPPRNVLNVV